MCMFRFKPDIDGDFSVPIRPSSRHSGFSTRPLMAEQSSRYTIPAPPPASVSTFNRSGGSLRPPIVIHQQPQYMVPPPPVQVAAIQYAETPATRIIPIIKKAPSPPPPAPEPPRRRRPARESTPLSSEDEQSDIDDRRNRSKSSRRGRLSQPSSPLTPSPRRSSYSRSDVATIGRSRPRRYIEDSRRDDSYYPWEREVEYSHSGRRHRRHDHQYHR